MQRESEEVGEDRKKKCCSWSIFTTIIMGIIRLGQFFKKSFPQLMKIRSPESYRGRTFAVDASSTIYSFLSKTISYYRHMQLIRKTVLTFQLTLRAIWLVILSGFSIELYWLNSLTLTLFGSLMECHLAPNDKNSPEEEKSRSPPHRKRREPLKKEI